MLGREIHVTGQAGTLLAVVSTYRRAACCAVLHTSKSESDWMTSLRFLLFVVDFDGSAAAGFLHDWASVNSPSIRDDVAGSNSILQVDVQ